MIVAVVIELILANHVVFGLVFFVAAYFLTFYSAYFFLTVFVDIISAINIYRKTERRDKPRIWRNCRTERFR